MDVINDRFKENVENINFLELMPGTKVELGDFIIEDQIPLPVVHETLFKNIKEEAELKSLENSIKIEYIVEGIIEIIGSDLNFKYNDKYIDLLKAYNSNIEEYIFYLAMKDLEENKIDKAAIKLRTILKINPKNVKANFNYGIALEIIGSGMLKEEVNRGNKFVKEATKFFERVLDLDENFSYAYYKLGYHYKNSGQFLKASLTWEKFLEKNKDEDLKQSIRDEITLIEEDTNMETAITYLLYNDYDKALNYLNKLMPKYKEMWNVNMLMGRAYAGLEEYERASSYYKKSIKLNPKEADPYNELAIMYINISKMAKAIDTLSEAIEKGVSDYKIYFNRALAYIQIGQLENAEQDLNKSLELNPKDQNLKSHIDEVKEQLNL